MKKNHSCYRRRYLKHIALVLLFYPLSALGAQGHISIKGQSITIMQAIQLLEKKTDYKFFYNAADLEERVVAVFFYKLDSLHNSDRLPLDRYVSLSLSLIHI